MTRLREMRVDELSSIATMEQQSHARAFVLPTTLDQHRKNFHDPDQIYLSIETLQNELAGYFILHHPAGSAAVEFRRIVIDERHRGIGQQAIALMEDYCRGLTGCERIWLDVFDDNAKGIHVYEKLGYEFDRTELFQGRALRFYSKAL